MALAPSAKASPGAAEASVSTIGPSFEAAPQAEGGGIAQYHAGKASQYHFEAGSGLGLTGAEGSGEVQSLRPESVEPTGNYEYRRRVSSREFGSRVITRAISQIVGDSDQTVGDSDSAVSWTVGSTFLRASGIVHLVVRKHQSISPWNLEGKCEKSVSISAQKCLASTSLSAVSRPPSQERRELQDSRLMVQIGLLLGLAYLGFLAVWFWTTRFRTKLRR